MLKKPCELLFALFKRYTNADQPNEKAVKKPKKK
jgi:hypothetical protein